MAIYAPTLDKQSTLQFKKIGLEIDGVLKGIHLVCKINKH